MAHAMTYAVHTDTCTYLLDDDGVCRWIVSPKGLMPNGASAAVGAQFVACLDLAIPGGLVGELRVGGAALFVRPDEDGRMVLLRTTPIRDVETRPVPAPAPPKPARPSRPRAKDPEETVTLVKPLYRPIPPQRPPAPRPPAPRRPTPLSVSPPTPALPSSPPIRPAPPPPRPSTRRGTDPTRKRTK